MEGTTCGGQYGTHWTVKTGVFAKARRWAYKRQPAAYERSRMHRVLIAAQPAGAAVLQRMLEGIADSVATHSRADAFTALDQDAASIVSTVAFDESRMIDFLQAVKREPAMRDIPFLCMRVLPTVLSDSLIGQVGAVCRDCGAVDMLDIATLGDQEGQAALIKAVLRHAGRGAAKPD